MDELGVRRVSLGKFKPQGTDSSHGYGYAPNLLGELDSVDSAHQVWVSDTTYIKTEEGWAFLAVTMDLATRYIAGWSASTRNDSRGRPCLRTIRFTVSTQRRHAMLFRKIEFFSD